MLGAEFSYTILGSFRDAATGTDRNIPPVLVGSGTVGLDF